MGPPSPKHKKVFKRFETDTEYRKRLIEAGVPSWRVYDVSSKQLDKVGDDHKPMTQRRILEDVS